MRRFFSRGFRPSRRHEQLFPYDVRAPTGAGRESWHISVTGRDSGLIGQNSWLFCPISLFSCSGGFRARAEKPATVELVPPGIYRRGLASAGLVLGCVFSRAGTCRGGGKADLGEIYLLRALHWGGTLRNPANTTRKACGSLVARSAGKGRRWPPAASRTTPTLDETVSGPAPVERRARSGRDEAFSRDLANRTRSFRVPRNPAHHTRTCV